MTNMKKFKLSQYILHAGIVYTVCTVYSNPEDRYDLLRVFPKEDEPLRYVHASTMALWDGYGENKISTRH